MIDDENYQFSLKELEEYFDMSFNCRKLLYENVWNNIDVKTLVDVFDTKKFEKYKKLEEEFTNFKIESHEVVEGVLECNKCKNKKIFSYSSQVRSGDEPTSVFAICFNCRHKWVQ